MKKMQRIQDKKVTRRGNLVLEVQGLSISYKEKEGEFKAVNDVSFHVHQRETVGIVGESGCGKSSIAYGIVNFLGINGHISGGDIKFQGKNLVGLPQSILQKIRGNQIAMVYQDPMQALNPVIKISDQLTEVLTFHQNMSKDEARLRSIEMLKKLYMSDASTIMDRYPYQLSGGQQQRVVIAMAMLNNPKLLIMDEPTTALDVTVEAVILDLIEELKKDFDTGIIYITHDLGVIARVSSRVNVMYAGEIVEKGSVQEIFNNPIHPYTRGLLRCLPSLYEDKTSLHLYSIKGTVPSLSERPESGCIFASRCDYTSQECMKSHPDLIEVFPDHWVRCSNWKKVQGYVAKNIPIEMPGGKQEKIENKILKVEKLKIYYEQKSGSFMSFFSTGKKQFIKAVDDISFQLKENKTLGVVGESGCGKSTLARGIIGLEKISGGKVDFINIDISKPLNSRTLNIIKNIQMVFQNPDSTLNPSFTVGKQIARPLRRFNITPKKYIRSEVENLLEAVRLSSTYYKRFPRQLSGGEKQRVGIARALATQPKLLICDEPVSALDVSVQAAVLNLLKDIQKNTRLSIMFITHNLSVVRFFAEYILVMYLGQIVEYGPTESIFRPPYHPYTEALLSAIPIPDPNIKKKRIRLSGEVPSSLNPPKGCRFHTRCPRRSILPDSGRICENQEPPLQKVDENHQIMCHIPLDELLRYQKENE